MLKSPEEVLKKGGLILQGERCERESPTRSEGGLRSRRRHLVSASVSEIASQQRAYQLSD